MPLRQSEISFAVFAFLVALLCALHAIIAQVVLARPTYKCEPVNPDATPEVRALLKILRGPSGKGILTGQHHFLNHLRHSARVSEMVGKYPPFWGSDFGFLDGEDKDS